jgi:hypothetical protein
MNKNIIYKSTACILIGAAIFGTSILLPDFQSSKAAVYSKTLCTHTTIKVSVGPKKQGMTTREITINSKKGNYSHYHFQTIRAYNNHFDCEETSEVISGGKKWKYEVDYINSNALNKSTILYTKETPSNSSKIPPTVKTTFITNPPTCSSCKLKFNTPTSTLNIKCPCCSRTAKINLKTGKIS